MTARADLGVAELVHAAELHLAAELRRHYLHAVADAEYRHAKGIDRRRRRRRTRLEYRSRPARENHTARPEGAQRRLVHVPGMDFAVNTKLAHTAADELRVLRTEIEYQDAIGVDIRRALRNRGNWAPPW